MKLRIDTSDSEVLVVGLGDREMKSEARKKASQKLLPTIEKLLKESSLEFSDISEIEVNTGPGSYTGIRVGVSVANALAWKLEIPINGKKPPENFITEINY